MKGGGRCNRYGVSAVVLSMLKEERREVSRVGRLVSMFGQGEAMRRETGVKAQEKQRLAKRK